MVGARPQSTARIWPPREGDGWTKRIETAWPRPAPILLGTGRGSLANGMVRGQRQWQARPSRRIAARDTRGPAWRRSARQLGRPVDRQTPRARSGWEWQGAQSLQGEVEMVSPGSALGKIPIEAAGLVGDDLYGQPSGVGWEATRGEMIEPHAVLQVADAFSISAWRRWSASRNRVSPSRSFMKAW